ncbi:hypothetical protein T4B_8302 [Trichinella pseudospiralis]|uniref:Uncharacterized protein n=1 Tax=Trichinella pseudospiralis TaxID=6337 RepID=A0A0V1IAP4_TRIPS|nr:hypothetical protein T4B_8302 [Trichinella pseudospiralis]
MFDSCNSFGEEFSFLKDIPLSDLAGKVREYCESMTNQIDAENVFTNVLVALENYFSVNFCCTGDDSLYGIMEEDDECSTSTSNSIKAVTTVRKISERVAKFLEENIVCSFSAFRKKTSNFPYSAFSKTQQYKLQGFFYLAVLSGKTKEDKVLERDTLNNVADYFQAVTLLEGSKALNKILENFVFPMLSKHLPRHLTCLYMLLNVSLPSKLKKYRKFVESDSEDDVTRMGEDTVFSKLKILERISQTEKIPSRHTDKAKSDLSFKKYYDLLKLIVWGIFSLFQYQLFYRMCNPLKKSCSLLEIPHHRFVKVTAEQEHSVDFTKYRMKSPEQSSFQSLYSVYRGLSPTTVKLSKELEEMLSSSGSFCDDSLLLKTPEKHTEMLKRLMPESALSPCTPKGFHSLEESTTPDLSLRGKSLSSPNFANISSDANEPWSPETRKSLIMGINRVKSTPNFSNYSCIFSDVSESSMPAVQLEDDSSSDCMSPLPAKRSKTQSDQDADKVLAPATPLFKQRLPSLFRRAKSRLEKFGVQTVLETPPDKTISDEDSKLSSTAASNASRNRVITRLNFN